MKGVYKISNSGKIGQIEILGEIGWWPTDSESFRRQIRELKDAGVEYLEVYINSTGGSVIHANEIVNELKTFGGNGRARLGAICASAATIIANSFKRIEAASNTLYMIHNPKISMDGEEKDLESGLQLLKSVKAQMIKDYSTRTGLTNDLISEMMDKTTWLNSERAKELKFIDEVTGDVAPLENITSEIVRGLKNVPEVLNAALRDENLNINEGMLKKLIADLGIVKVDATETEIAAALTNHIGNLKKEVTELQTKLKALESDSIKSFLDSAQNDSQKITAEQRQVFEKMAKEGQFENVKSLVNAMQGRVKLSNQVHGSSQAGVRADWDFDKWQKEDPKGLAKMEAEENEKFRELMNKKYKVNQ